MKSSAILREAARMVEAHKYSGSCAAINSAGFHHRLEWANARQIMVDYFYRDTHSGYWWAARYHHGPRIIGLCLAAAIAESEGD